jgi:glycosyltransferase involved in cell wall biosynthesis
MRISVVVPVRDGERHLGAALDSLLAQDRPPDELLVVDDGSADGSAALARAVPGVRVLELEGRGPAAARNAGVAAATGEAIAFLDADDLADPRRLLLQERVLVGDPGADGVAAGMENFVSPDCPPQVAARLDFPRGPLAGWHAGANLTIVQRETLAGGYLDTARAAIARRRATEDAA